MPKRIYTDKRTGEPLTLVRWYVNPMTTWSQLDQKPSVGKAWIYQEKATEPDQKDTYTVFYGPDDYAMGQTELEALSAAGIHVDETT